MQIIFTITKVDIERFSLFWTKHALVPENHQLLPYFVDHLLQLGFLEKLETIHQTLPLQVQTNKLSSPKSDMLEDLKVGAIDGAG